MKKDKTIRWLYSVPKGKKIYVLLLILVQMLHGGSGVLYALLLRNIVDNATSGNPDGFAVNALFIILLPYASGMAAPSWWLDAGKAILRIWY